MLFKTNNIHGLHIKEDADAKEFFKGNILDTEGVTEIVPDKKDGTYSLEQLQKAIGGYIELIKLPGVPNMIAIIDEEGRMKSNLKKNIVATMICGQDIVGNVCIIDTKDFD